MNRISSIQNHLSFSKQQISRKLRPHLKAVYQNYLHSYETRTDQEIKQTTQIIRKLSQQNLARLNDHKIGEKGIFTHEKLKGIIFICLHGITPFPDEFQFLNLPPKSTFYILPAGLQYDQSQENRIKSIPCCTCDFHADKINKIVQQNSNKEVIFIYHSFGTYFLSTYFQKYGTHRVKGLIELGAAPIRQYLYISQMINYTLNFTIQDLMQKTDELAGKKFQQLMKKINNELKINWEPFHSNSQRACFLAYFKSAEFSVMFDLNRRYPNVLKLLIFGEEDSIFETDLLTQRAFFYIKQKLQKQKLLTEKYINQYHFNKQRIQSKFIFMIPGGKHSVHMQKKNRQIISKALNQYLSLILND